MKRAVFLFSLGALLVSATAMRANGQNGQQPPPAQPPPPASPTAQPPATPPAAEEPGAPLNKLGLSDDQKKQIHDIRKQSQQQVQDVHSDTSLTQQQQTQQIRQIRHKAAQQVDGVLTPDQRAKYDAWRKAHQRAHHQPKTQQQPS